MCRFCSASYILLVLTLLNVLATATHAGAKGAAVRQAIISAYHRENVAVQHRDVAGAIADVSPRWYAVMPNGSILTYSEFVRNVRSSVPFTKSCTFNDKVLSFSVKGNLTRVVTKNMDTQVVVNPQTQQTLTVVTDGKILDYWQRQKGRWMHTWSKYLSYKASSHPNLEP